MSKKLLPLFFILQFPLGGQCANLLGAELTYTNVGKDSVLVKITTYRSCKDKPVNSLTMYVGGVGFSYGDTHTVYATACKRVTPTASGQCDKCDASNCNADGYPNGSNASCAFPYGFEQVVFEQLIILPKDTSGKMCQFRFWISECCRSIQSTACCIAQKLYNYTEMDRCTAPGNSSPQFTCEPTLLAVSLNCLTMCFSAFDVDGDSVSYQLEQPLIAFGTGVVYNSPYTYKLPLKFKGWPKPKPTPGSTCSGFNADSIRGIITFTPTQQEVTNLVFIAKEWRKINGKMRLIGIIRRDQIFYVQANITSKIPTLSGPFSQTICAGDTARFFGMRTRDPDTADTVRVRYAGNMKGATFKSYFDSASKHESWDWEWPTSIKDASTNPYTFTMEAKDDHSPLTQKTCAVYSIRVKECPTNTRMFKDLGCGLIRVSAQPDSGYNNGQLSYHWYYNGKKYTARDTVIKVQRGSPATITHEFWHNKYAGWFSDTVSVSSWLKLSVADDGRHCPGEAFTVKTQVQNQRGAVQFSWNGGSLAAADSMVFHPTKKDTITVLAQDSSGCTQIGQVSLHPFAPVLVNLGNDTAICKETTLTISNQNHRPDYHNKWSNGDTSLGIQADTSQLYVLTVIDSNQCTQTDTLLVQRFPEPFAGFTFKQMGLTVIPKPDSLNYSNYHWDFGNGFQVDSISPYYTYSNFGTYRIRLTVTDQHGCLATDSQQVQCYTGLTPLSTEEGLGVRLYPNPTTGNFIVSYTLKKPGTVSLSLFDVNGKMVLLLMNGLKQAGENKQEIEAGSLAEGVYWLRIIANGELGEVKVEVVR